MYLKFPVDISRERCALVDPEIDAEFVINRTAELVLLDVDVESFSDVQTLAVRGNEIVIPFRNVVLQRSVWKKCNSENNNR